MLVLGIESSCDETGIALYHPDRGIVAHSLYSQVKLHAQYGGVVPELASRDHIRKISPLIQETLQKGGYTMAQLEGIAFTKGPGLMGALMVGAATGRSLGLALGIPTIGVHHMEGHLLAPMLEDEVPAFPFLALLVSGGHTLLVQVNALGDYQVLGESLDDAVGEAFDKTAKLLGLAYPGGPALAALAQQGTAERYTFPRPMTTVPGLDFSFSGLKTHVMTTWKESDQSEQTKADIAHAFETAAIDTLVKKCRRALKQTGLTRLVVAGGVGANQLLREQLATLESSNGTKTYFPRPEYCTDNGAMIAYAGYCRLAAGECEGDSFQPLARWSLESLQAPA